MAKLVSSTFGMCFHAHVHRADRGELSSAECQESQCNESGRVTLGSQRFVNWCRQGVLMSDEARGFQSLLKAPASGFIVQRVYIAYKNAKRAERETTFGFVRFNKLSEANRTVERGDGRRIDGFKIRVFRDNMGGKTITKVDNRDVLVGTNTSDVGERTGKEMNGDLRYIKKAEMVYVDMMDDVAGNPATERESSIDHIYISNSEQSWRRQCLVGQIKNMYNLEIVQDALKEEGFDIRVCPWAGLLSVIQFMSREELVRCWNRRSELVSLWFEELELLEGNDGKRKVKVWVIIRVVPLQVWNDKFFHGLASKRGEVLKIDEDTHERNRFDVAKVLVSVQKVSIIPERMLINVNGRCMPIKTLTEKFEDDPVLIDGTTPMNGQFRDDFGEEFSSPECVADLEKVRASKQMLRSLLRTVDYVSSRSNGLHEIPVLAGSGMSISVEGAAEHVRYEPSVGCSREDAVQVWSSNMNSIATQEEIEEGSSRAKRKNNKKNKARVGKGRRKVGGVGKDSEAEISLTVGEALGFIFKAPDAKVAKRFEELEEDFRC
ncbi:uncharacterized protein LOC120217380 [Hibiscus syriacus]|uniref:uncharacterized protein LOC120217380 n=1 Tax=Hibiscus syriacus TaxID=106335 RepID=UPI0019226741|nr:uncharacterized protein LOC120217380 [Hibiscus syriacus]